MKKLMAILLSCVMAASLAGCAQSEGGSDSGSGTSNVVSNNSQADSQSKTEESKPEESKPEKITIKSYNAERALVDLEVPYDPQKIAILDMASLDIIDALGLGDRVVGSASTTIDYLVDKYSPDKNNKIANLGTIKTADMVEVMACEPDIIFIGGRLSKVYNELSEIAPVVYLATDSEAGVVKSTADNAKTIASIFGKEAEIDALVNGYESRIAALKEKAAGKTAVVGLYSGSNFSVLGNDGRCSVIGKEIGFNNLGVGAGEVTSTHGNDASWETIVSLNPNYIFVLDRNTAISSTEGNPAVAEAIENDLIKELDVYKNGNIVYLAHPNIWYTAEGGIKALDVMISDIETALK